MMKCSMKTDDNNNDDGKNVVFFIEKFFSPD